MSNTRFHNSWKEMVRRCTDKNSISFANYGGRGIKVCPEWSDFENFKRDMYASFREHSEAYGEKNTTLDRVDSDKDYCLSNCRWATYDVQVRNRRPRKDSKTGVTGVMPYGDGRYRVRIKVNRVSKHIGLFDDFDEAVKARREAEKKYWSGSE